MPPRAAKPSKPVKIVDLLFPAKGVARNLGYQQLPPFATPYAVNVRPFDPIAMRQRGGSRPGLKKFDTTQLGGGAALQMIAFATVFGANAQSSNMLLAVANGTLYQNSTGSFASVSGALNSSAHQLRSTQANQKVYIADYRPVNVAGSNGSIASGNQLSDPAIADWTTLSIDMAKDVVWISGQVNLESNIFPITSVAAGHIVFDATAAPISNQSGGATWQIGRITKVFDPTNPTAALKPLMDSLPIPPANYSTGTVSSVLGAVTLAGGGDWTNVPQAGPTTLLVLTIPNQSGIGTQQYLVASGPTFTGGQWTLTLTDTTTDANCTNVAYGLAWATTYYGIPPLNTPLCCTYRGRLVLAGGYIWYMSRVLDATDWDYGFDPQDPSRAVAGTSTSTGGIPDPLTALIPHSDDYLIFGCEKSLWLLTSDPAYGGTITNLSRSIGVLGPAAWCVLPDGTMVFLSRDGLYSIPPGQMAPPSPISRPALPKELLDIDYQANNVSLCYDVEARGIHISVTPWTGGGAGVHYFVDVVNNGFWTVTLPATMLPTQMAVYTAGPNSPSLPVFGCLDGYVRNYDLTQTTDDGTAFTSSVCIGPLRLGGPGREGIIIDLTADLDTNSGNVALGVFLHRDAEKIIEDILAGDAPFLTRTLLPGSNHAIYLRCRGGATGLLLTGTPPWAIEALRMTSKMGGRIR